MQYLKLKPRESKESMSPSVYADLDDLIRLQFKVHGFSFLPKQPMQSLLAGQHASWLRGRGLDSEEIHRYIPGDDILNMEVWVVT